VNHAKNKGVYYVYRIDTLNFKYELINQGCGGSSSTTDSFIVDNCNFKTGNYIYGVGNEILVTTGSGTFFNHSMLALSKLAHVNSAVDIALSAELWPNPSNGNFSVKFSQKQIIKSAKLFNLQGQLLEVMDLEKVKSVNSNEYIFELNSSIKGMYYLQLQSENGISILEIILN
jgi:hypothetical protein